MPVTDHESLLARSRCTAVFAELGADPIGSAGSPAGGFLLFEQPLPWPHDVDDIAERADLLAVAKAARARPQALVPAAWEPGSVTLTERIIAYVPNPGAGPAFLRREATATPREAAAVAERLLAPVEETSEGQVADDGGYVDVLVCTHGSRDVCCGSTGSALHSTLAANLAGRSVHGATVRVWRTSHTGGHRFAPTVLTFPDGLSWAWVDARIVEGVLDRTLPVEEAAVHLRGALGLPGPAAQVVDRAALLVEGWAWVGSRREAEADPAPKRVGDPPATVTLRGSTRDGSTVTHSGVVEVRRELPVPPCGFPVSEARKSTAELAIVSFK